MNKLAAINLAIEEVNKQANFIGTAYRGLSSLSRRGGNAIVSGASKARSFIKPPPPVGSAGGAAANAQKQGKVMGLVGGKLGLAGLGASMLPGVSNPLH